MPTMVMPTCTVGRKRFGSSASASAVSAPRTPRFCMAINRDRREDTMASSDMAKAPFSRTSSRMIKISRAVPMR